MNIYLNYCTNCEFTAETLRSAGTDWCCEANTYPALSVCLASLHLRCNIWRVMRRTCQMAETLQQKYCFPAHWSSARLSGARLSDRHISLHWTPQVWNILDSKSVQSWSIIFPTALPSLEGTRKMFSINFFFFFPDQNAAAKFVSRSQLRALQTQEPLFYTLDFSDALQDECKWEMITLTRARSFPSTAGGFTDLITTSTTYNDNKMWKGKMIALSAPSVCLCAYLEIWCCCQFPFVWINQFILAKIVTANLYRPTLMKIGILPQVFYDDEGLI